MANHFKTPEGGQDAVESTETRASHFALSSDVIEQPSASPQHVAPAVDSLASVDQSSTDKDTPVSALPVTPQSQANPMTTQASMPVIDIPDPLAPAAPESISNPVVTDDQRAEIADLEQALQSPDFTSVFAPVQDDVHSRAKASGADPVILFEHVTKVYPAQPNKPALDDVNIEIYPGEFVFLVGHSGSGKTTLLRTMTRDVKPTQGRVLVAGQDLTRIKNRKVPFFRRQIGTVFQDFKLLPGKTVYENVAFVLECIGKPRGVIRQQVPEVLRLVGLADQMDSMPDQLSGGEQQRVSVARAMVNRPPLLICDEPTGNLDPAISLGIMKLLEHINRTGTTVIVATHDREMVDSMHRRVIALEAGHVVRDQEQGGYGNYGI